MVISFYFRVAKQKICLKTADLKGIAMDRNGALKNSGFSAAVFVVKYAVEWSRGRFFPRLFSCSQGLPCTKLTTLLASSGLSGRLGLV